MTHYLCPGIFYAYERVIANWNKKLKTYKDFYKKTYLIENPLPIVDNEYGDIARQAWKLLLKGEDDYSPKVTFPMIARLAEYILKLNPIIIKMINMSFEYVFLDEFQDTTELQYDVIKKLFNNLDVKVVAVGDKKQRIMEWAGAKTNIFEEYKQHFNATEYTLLINHRSAPTLLKIQEKIVEEMIGNEVKISCSEKWQAESGKALLCQFNNDNQEASYLSKVIADLNCNGILLNDMAVLIRQTPDKYCEKLIHELNILGLEARYEDEYQSLLKEKVSQLLILILQLSIDIRMSAEWIELIELMKKIKGYYNISIVSVKYPWT